MADKEAKSKLQSEISNTQPKEKGVRGRTASPLFAMLCATIIKQSDSTEQQGLFILELKHKITTVQEKKYSSILN